MAKKPLYPLQQILEIKQRRVEEAEKIVRDKLQELAKEEEKLVEKKAERDKVLEHQRNKLKQLREELDGGTTSPKVQQMKVYLKVVQERLEAEEKKVQEQEARVQAAKEAVEAARRQLAIRRQEVDKLEMHKGEWTKDARKEEAVMEEREQDELGNIIYTIHRQKER